MASRDWHVFDNGTTLGTEGSEGGEIVRDDEHAFGARITLERETQTAQFAITCGVYGWMVHTRFFRSEVEAQAEYERMTIAISDLLRSSGDDGVSGSFSDRIAAFFQAYP